MCGCDDDDDGGGNGGDDDDDDGGDDGDDDDGGGDDDDDDGGGGGGDGDDYDDDDDVLTIAHPGSVVTKRGLKRLGGRKTIAGAKHYYVNPLYQNASERQHYGSVCGVPSCTIYKNEKCQEHIHMA